MPPPPPSTTASRIEEEVGFQRAAVARLKQEILGVDRNSRRRYIREFHEENARFESIASLDDLSIACFQSDLVYIGDYHALPDAQGFATWLLRDIASRSREVVLCLEMVYGRNQRTLDRYMRNEIGEAEFLKGIRYDLDWGYDWASFRRLFDAARELGVAVFGIDCEPRSGFRYIRRRDSYAAARIADIAERHPAARIVVVIGESHLATRHLPRKVTASLKRRGLQKKGLIVLQNLEEIYWQLAERGQTHVDVVRLGPQRFCHFNASPIAKYEAYRHTIEIWSGDGADDGRVDLTSTVYSMIDTILRFLGVDKYSHAVRRRGRHREILVDLYPEVYSGLEVQELRTMLGTQPFEPEEIDEILAHVERNGSCYIPRINAVFIGQLNMVHAGEEAAHFVNLALKGELYEAAPREMPQHDLFYGGVMEEALGFFGSKLIDPSRNHFFETEFYQYYRKDRETIESLTPYSFEDFNAIIHFILLHKRFERAYHDYPAVPLEILDGIRSEPRRANILIHELGYFLGQQIYDGYRSGLLDRRRIARLFRQSFRTGSSALSTYIDLVGELRPVAESGAPALAP
ncbi:MAG TPA: ChaN family lipoprotein [Candidatus Polarisedimenticolia bacterium]|nr:ChaN family lipoprotein [Candidatus Polarisedimenticolia bacterium]